MAGQGELAYIAAGRPYLLGGPAGTLVNVRLPGLASAPSWSPDHRWLAVEVSAPAPAADPYLTGPAALYLLRADGTGLRTLTPKGWNTQQYAWAPALDELAAVVIPPATGTGLAASRLETIAPAAGTARVLLSAAAITGIAWAPAGRTLAVGVGVASGPPGSSSFHWTGRLEALPADGGPARLVTFPERLVPIVTRYGQSAEETGW